MGEMLASVWVPGVPRTKGSLDARHQDTAQSKQWRKLMASAVLRARTAPTYAGPVAVECAFVTPDASRDIDKLARNVLDAIGCTRTDDAHLIVDDSYVEALTCYRVVGKPEECGALITVQTIDFDRAQITAQWARQRIAEVRAWV
jgi:Holliday junction resolvase RusA-like endonuclease